MTARIIFSNTTGEFLVQTDTETYSFNATSGKGECMNNQVCEATPNIGPTPIGSYYIIPSRLDDPGFIHDSGRRVMSGDWGDFRIEMYAQQGTNTHGRDKMFIHGGDMQGSKGCIDIGGGVLGNYASDKIKEIIKDNAGQGVIGIDVINGPIMFRHRNKPMDVHLPRGIHSSLPNYTQKMAEVSFDEKLANSLGLSAEESQSIASQFNFEGFQESNPEFFHDRRIAQLEIEQDRITKQETKVAAQQKPQTFAESLKEAQDEQKQIDAQSRSRGRSA
jgi:Protein of unknown function (DUF2778)